MTAREKFTETLNKLGRVHQLALTEMGFTGADRRWLSKVVKAGQIEKRPYYGFSNVTFTYHPMQETAA